MYNQLSKSISFGEISKRNAEMPSDFFPREGMELFVWSVPVNKRKPNALICTGTVMKTGGLFYFENTEAVTFHRLLANGTKEWLNIEEPLDAYR